MMEASVIKFDKLFERGEAKEKKETIVISQKMKTALCVGGVIIIGGVLTYLGMKTFGNKSFTFQIENRLDRAFPALGIGASAILGNATEAMGCTVSSIVDNTCIEPEVAAVEPGSALVESKTTATSFDSMLAESKTVEIDSFVRNLPENQHASEAAINRASEAGVVLGPNQTYVGPQSRTYSK